MRKLLALLGSSLIAIAFIPTTVAETGCTKQQLTQIDGVAVDLTNAVCAVAENQPSGQPWVDVVCTIAQGVETGIATLEQGDAGVAGSAIRTVKIRMPASEVPAFIAAHSAKKAS